MKAHRSLMRAVSAYLLLVLPTACSSSEEPINNLPLALQSVVDGRIVPAVSSFVSETEAFATAADDLCATPDEPSLIALQNRWLSMARQWNRLAPYIFGPLDDDPIIPSFIFIESMRQRGVDYTNTVRTTRDSALNGAETLDEAFFNDLGFNRIGLLALEVLSFETSTSTPTASPNDIIDEYDQQPRKCVYIQGLSQQLVTRAQRVQQQWTASFGDSGTDYRSLFLDADLPDGVAPEVQLLVAVIDQLEFVRRRKLEGIVDARAATAAQPGARPFFANLTATIEEIERLLNAREANVSLFDVMTERGRQADVRAVEGQIQTARALIEADDLDEIADAFLELETSFRQEIPLALGIELGLNFSDG
ncbi:MAG: imelysin family protein, partial [Myxococcota bacterium]